MTIGDDENENYDTSNINLIGIMTLIVMMVIMTMMKKGTRMYLAEPRETILC